MRITTVLIGIQACFTTLLLAGTLNAQSISLDVKKAPVQQVLKSIEQQAKVSFVYDEQLLQGLNNLSIKINNKSLADVLKLISKHTPLQFKRAGNVIGVTKAGTQNQLSKPKDKKAMGRQPPILIKGKITDANGQPLPGVNITVKGTNISTITTSDGNYQIEAEVNSILVFSYVGFQSQEIPVNSRVEINLSLTETLGQLDQVQIIGYGTTTRRLNTGNVSSVKSEVLEHQPVSNPLQALAGRIAGLQITQDNGLPGASITVRIRGRNSITASNDPLYIVDGVPFPSASNDRIRGPQGFSNPLNLISPNNIESVEVLKDADAASIYGSRAANGVILITTKKGKIGKTKFDLNVNAGVGDVTRTARMLNSQQYLQVRRDAFTNSNLTLTTANAYDLLSYDPNAYFDWQDWIIGGTAKTTDATLTISGGNQQTNFLLGTNYREENTIRKFDKGYKRGNIQLSVTHASENKKFNISTNLFYTTDKNDLKFDQTGGAYDIVVRSIPNYPVYDASGDLNWVNNQRNFLASYTAYLKGLSSNINGSTALSYLVLPGLNIKSSFGFNMVESDQVNASPSTSINQATGVLPSSTFGEQNRKSYVVEPQLTYTKVISKGTFNLLIGGTLQRTTTKATTISVSNYNNDLLIENPGFGTPFVSGQNSTYNYISAFGRITYNWNDKYILNTTFRRDGSSRFGPGKQFANFGSVGAAWLFSNEPFAKENLTWLSYGKFRGSYGTTGSDGIGDYGYLNFYNVASNYGAGISINPSQIANSQYQWEVNKKLEIALETGFIKDRFLLNVAWYRNVSGNQLVQYALPSMTGFASYTANLPALVQNKGWEFELTSRNISKKDFDWSMDFNLTIPKNKLVSFPGLGESTYANTYVEGQPLSIIQRYEFLGIDPATGLSVIKDQNNDGVLTAVSAYNGQGGDYVIVGNTDPKLFAGLNNTFRFNNFKLDIFLQYTRQDGYNIFSQSPQLFGRQVNFYSDYLGYWKQPGDQASVPKPFAASNPSLSNYSASSAGFSDASFLRIKNVSFSYEFPTSSVSRSGIGRLRVYMQGQNLWTITNFKGNDPENSSSPTFTTPIMRTLVAGLQCSF